MANTKTKIERLGLCDRVEEMLKSGIATGKQITEILRAEGHTLSESSVNRYLQGVRDTITPQAFKLIRDHVDKQIPEDLEALEGMESQALEWAGENPKDIADRIRQARMEIEGEVDKWADMILTAAHDSSQKLRRKAVDRIVQTCLSYFTIDARAQNKRIQAMQTAIKIIELKLRNAGLLDDDTKGRIVIMDRSDEYEPQNKSTGGRTLYSVGVKDDNGAQ